MIRQPDFVTEDLFQQTIEHVRMKKKHLSVQLAKYERFSDGLCLQMMHHGSYDDEPATFSIMEKYCEENGLVRIDKRHKEIYISDVRKTVADK